MQNNLIFVSIAAYRDPQLNATVADCLSKAHQPGAFAIWHLLAAC